MVAIQPIVGLRRGSVHARPGQNKNVHPSVVIKIDERAAAPHRFQNVVGVIGLAVDGWRGKAGGARDVSESRVEWPAGGGWTRLGLYAARSDALGQRVRPSRGRGERKQQRTAGDFHDGLNIAQSLALSSHV